jgi:hypothetical protein
MGPVRSGEDANLPLSDAEHQDGENFQRNPVTPESVQRYRRLSQAAQRGFSHLISSIVQSRAMIRVATTPAMIADSHHLRIPASVTSKAEKTAMPIIANNSIAHALLCFLCAVPISWPILSGTHSIHESGIEHQGGSGQGGQGGSGQAERRRRSAWGEIADFRIWRKRLYSLGSVPARNRLWYRIWPRALTAIGRITRKATASPGLRVC